MKFQLENENGDHFECISSAFQDFRNVDPDIFFITEDGIKVFTHKILLIMYSPTLKTMLKESDDSSDVTGISVPTATATDLMNLIQVLSEGVAFATEKQSLLKIGKIAKLLGIVLKDMQLGNRRATISESSKSHLKIRETKDNFSDSLKFTSNEIHKEGIENIKKDEEVDELSQFEKYNDSDKLEKDSKVSIQKEIQKACLKGNKGGKRKFSRPREPPKLDCDVCGKLFKNKWILGSHMLIHTGEKPFKCEICGRDYRRKERMERCQMIHAGYNESHSCEMCGKIMSSKNILQRHMTDIHSEVKPFTCDVCGKAFARFPVMQDHKLSHSESNYFECEYCGNKFSRSNALKRHQMHYCKSIDLSE